MKEIIITCDRCEEKIQGGALEHFELHNPKMNLTADFCSFNCIYDHLSEKKDTHYE